MSIKDAVPDYDAEKYGFPVPDMPPVDNKMEPDSHKGNWLWMHYDTPNHNYQNEDSLEPMPAPLTDPVTPENPLKVDVFYSMRSPYSYLALQRYTWLNSNYNADVTIKVIFPVAVRTPDRPCPANPPSKPPAPPPAANAISSRCRGRVH